jgi:3-hydroxymyristoyl/3-hydroxydecanoyl-(acyl carrier protein) dehydratase
MSKSSFLNSLKITLSRRKALVVRKEEIAKILPHRGRMLLLDKLTIAGGRVTGEFTVTEDVCEGHAVLGNSMVFRGVDILEMTAQILGVYWGIQHPEFVDKKGMLRGFGGSKFHKPVFIGDQLRVEVLSSKIIDRILGGPEKEKMIIRVTGQDFTARVGRERRATIKAVELALI